MGSLAAALVGGLVLLGLGDSLLALLRRGERRLAWDERLGLAFALGAGGVSLLLFWGSLVLPGEVGVACVLVPTALVVAARLALERPRALRWRRPAAGELLSLAVLAGLVSLNAVVSIGNDLVGDALLVWGLKARIAFSAHGLPLASLGDASRLFSHPDYPWLVPLDETFLYLLAGEPRGALAKALCPGFLAALLLLFRAGARRLASRPIGDAGTLVLALLPQLGYWATMGYADLPLALFALGSVLALLEWHEGARARDLVLASVLAGLAAWTKREGLVFAAFQGLAITGALLDGQRRRLVPRALAGHALVVLAIAAPWLVLVQRAHVPGNDFVPASLAAFTERSGRLPGIVGAALRELAWVWHWGVLWFAFPIAAFLGEGPRGRAVYLGLAALVPLGVLLPSYALSAWVPWEQHVETSLSRLVLQAAPIALLFVLVRLRGPLSTLHRLGRACLSR